MAFEILLKIVSAHTQIFKVANNESMNIKELLYKFLRIFMTPRNVACSSFERLVSKLNEQEKRGIVLRHVNFMSWNSEYDKELFVWVPWYTL